MALQDFLQGLALLETQGGTKTIKGPNGEDSYNLYNIKDFSGKGFRAYDKAEGSRDAYRVYASPDEATADVMGLLQRRYPAALQAQTPVEFAQALKQGGYATDPNYVNKLVGAIDRVQGAKPAPEQVLALPANQLAAFSAQGLDPVIAEARARGYTDQEIAQRLSGAGPDVATRLQAQSVAVEGMGSSSQLKAFRDAGYGELIDSARERGYSDKEIALKLGGQELQAGIDARSKADARGFLGNVVEGARNALGDVGEGAKQLGARLTGDDARLAQLQAQQRAELSSLDRRATDTATGSGVGSFGVKAVPYVAAGMATGGTGLLPMVAAQGAAGAVEGALTPTTGEGQFAKNIVTDAALAALGTGALGLAGKGMSATASRALRPSADAVEEATKRAALADRFELPKTPAMLNDRARSVLEAMPGAKAEAEDVARQALSRQLLKGIGQEGAEVTPEVIARAQKSIYSDADRLLKDVKVSSDVSDLAPKLTQVVDDYKANTLNTYRSAEVEGVTQDLLDKVAEGNMSAQALVQARKNIMNNAWRADGDTKAALQAIGRVVDEHLTKIAPDAKAALDKANQQWGRLQVLEKVVEMTRGQNTMTVPQLATAIKTTSRNLFQTGDAPYQDLADASLKLYGPTSSKGLAAQLAGVAGRGSNNILTGAAIFEPTLGLPALAAKWAVKQLATKAVNSENPTVVRLLTGATDGTGTNAATDAFISKALGGAESAASALSPAAVKALADELRKKR